MRPSTITPSTDAAAGPGRYPRLPGRGARWVAYDAVMRRGVQRTDQTWHSMFADLQPTASIEMRLWPVPIPRLATSQGDSMPASRRILVPLVAATALALGLPLPVFAGKTLDAVKGRGEVICGVNTSAPRFSSTSGKGRGPGPAPSLCLAVATR